MSQVVVGGDFWEGDAVREPVDGEGVANAEGARNVALVATVVVQRWTNIPAGDAVGCHAGPSVRCDVDDNTGARRGEGALVEIEIAVEAGVGGELGLAARGTEEIQSDVSLGHQEIPFGDGEFGIASGEARTKVVFPSLDRSFGGVAAMAVGRDQLEVDVVFFKCFFEVIGAFIVKDVEIWSVAIGLQTGVQAGPGFGDLAGLASFEGLGQDGVAIIIVEYHDVVVAAGRLDGEPACLVGVGFFKVFGLEDGGEDRVGA